MKMKKKRLLIILLDLLHVGFANGIAKHFIIG